MKVFLLVRNFFEDIFNKLRAYKWKAIFCAITAIVGLILGIVLFNLADYNWWYSNRCNYVQTLVCGNLGTLISFIIIYSIFFVILLVCNMYPLVRFLIYIEYLIFMLYCGANIAALIVCFGILGALYIIIVAIMEIIGIYFVFFICACECACQRSFKESFFDLKCALYLLIGVLVIKIMCIFIILRLITAFI